MCCYYFFKFDFTTTLMHCCECKCNMKTLIIRDKCFKMFYLIKKIKIWFDLLGYVKGKMLRKLRYLLQLIIFLIGYFLFSNILLSLSLSLSISLSLSFSLSLSLSLSLPLLFSRNKMCVGKLQTSFSSNSMLSGHFCLWD